MNIQDIAFIGVGNMGGAMVARLIERGYTLHLFDSNRERLEPLATQGARLAASPADAVKAVQLVITMVPGDPELEQIALGDNGILSTLPSSALHISFSTISPQLTQRLTDLYASVDRTFLGANVAGRPDRAIAGLLSIFISGPAWAKARVQPVLAALGSAIEDLGDVATTANGLKSAFNQMIGTHLLGMSYGAVTAQAYGVSPDRYFQILIRSGLFAGVVIEQYGAIMAKGSFDEDALFNAYLGLKDSRVIQRTEQVVGVYNPLMAHFEHLLQKAVEHGRGLADWSVIFQEVAEQAEKELRERIPSQSSVSVS